MIASPEVKEKLLDLFGHEKLEKLLHFIKEHIDPNAEIIDIFFVEELSEYAIDVFVPDQKPDFDRLWRVGGIVEELRRQFSVPFFLDFRFLSKS